MITVTDGPIIAVAGKESSIYDATTVGFLIEQYSTGENSVFIIFYDVDDVELVRFRAAEYVEADFDTSTTSVTNSVTFLLLEMAKLVKYYLEVINPAATFTIT